MVMIVMVKAVTKAEVLVFEMTEVLLGAKVLMIVMVEPVRRTMSGLLE